MASQSLKARLVQMACDISNQLRDVDEIQVEEILAAGLEQYVMIDVRPEAERAVSVIPGALSIDEFERNADSLNDKTLVAYCTAGYRSGVYARQQTSKGRSIFNLRGGVLSWCDHQQQLNDAEGNPTHRVHVYGKMWNLVSEPYEGVW